MTDDILTAEQYRDAIERAQRAHADAYLEVKRLQAEMREHHGTGPEPVEPTQPDDLDARGDDAIGVALAMSQAGARRDLDGIYTVWETVDKPGKVDVLAALAQLPAWILQCLGEDPTTWLAEGGRQLLDGGQT